MWQAQVFTLYPEVFPGPLSKGLYGKALSKNLWNLKIVNIRDAAEDKHKTVDDTPYGGGTGMLLKADVLAKSLDRNIKKGERERWRSTTRKIQTMNRKTFDKESIPVTDFRSHRHKQHSNFIIHTMTESDFHHSTFTQMTIRGTYLFCIHGNYDS